MAPVIRAQNVSKEYRLGARSALDDSFREWLIEGARRSLRGLRGGLLGENRRSARETIWALQGLSFDVQEGEVMGVVGRNGAGKSTLLKILSRITDPTAGEVRIRGRVSSLLEVGTGFHPELTGHENIFLNGAILGMRKAEIKSKLDEIVAFSGIEKFLDTPAKRYSSGMYVRLAFAVAAHLDPDILIVDEVLAVGDVTFQKKCLGKMDELRSSGRTVLFVSHNMAAVQHLCHRGVVLDQGQLIFDGTAKEAVEFYLKASANGNDQDSHSVDLSRTPRRRPPLLHRLDRLELFDGHGEPLEGAMPVGGALHARIHFQLGRAISSFNVCLGFNNLFGQRVFTAHTVCKPDRSLEERIGEQVFVCEIPNLTLVPGEYGLKVGLDVDNVEVDEVEEATRLTIVESDYYGSGKIPQRGLFVLPHTWWLK